MDFSSLPTGSLRVFALSSFDNATPADYVTWAESALVTGLDSPALRVLAGFDPRQLTALFEVRSYFARALNELNIALPGPEAIVRQYVHEVVEELAAGRREPGDALATIHAVAIVPLSHPHDLQPWCDLGDGLDPVTRIPFGVENIGARTLEFAKSWLRGRENPRGGAA